MRLYFETKKYPHKSGTLSLAIDTESKTYTCEDYFELSCRTPCTDAIIITISEMNKLRQKLLENGWKPAEWK